MSPNFEHQQAEALETIAEESRAIRVLLRDLVENVVLINETLLRIANHR